MRLLIEALRTRCPKLPKGTTFLSDSGKRKYIITTRRITSGDELK
jgi:hypothetical protein